MGDLQADEVSRLRREVDALKSRIDTVTMIAVLPSAVALIWGLIMLASYFGSMAGRLAAVESQAARLEARTER